MQQKNKTSISYKLKAKSSSFVFFGTPRFAVIVLDELKTAGLMPSFIVTAPDRPAGRGLRLTPPPVKLWAQENNVEFLQPEKLEIGNWKLEIVPQLFVVAAYGKILPPWLLKIPARGALNVHPSLLPKYRGPSPIQSHILADDRDVGVTIMLLDEKMDHGPIIGNWKSLARRSSYGGGEIGNCASNWPPRANELEEVLARMGGKLLANTIPRWLAGDITPIDQDHEKATYTKKVEKENGFIDLVDDQYQNFLKIRAYDSWPGVYFYAEKKGTKQRVFIKDALFKNGELTITRVLPESKKEMDYDDFLRGLHTTH